MKKTVLIFGLLAFAVIALLQVSKYTIISGTLSTEWIVASIAVIFFCIGVFLQKKRIDESKATTTTTTTIEIDQSQIDALGLSKREYEVLLEMAIGYSNKEIAERLFVSESTIKTHVSNIFVKLNAKRRTQAIQKAKTLQILPL